MIATVCFQADAITECERESFKKIFDEFDVNKDGHITASELSTVLKKLGQNPSAEELAEFIQMCDTDKNGTIEFGEFCKYLVDLRRRVSDNCLYILSELRTVYCSVVRSILYCSVCILHVITATLQVLWTIASDYSLQTHVGVQGD